mgnify:CR=1 FL=1
MAVKIGSLFGEVVIDTRKMEKGLKRANRKLRAFGRQASAAGKAMSVGVGAPLAGIGVVATKTFASFEQEMAKVKAISGATGDTFTRLENLAKSLGESTRFTAGEVAGLQLNLSKLGFTPKEIEKVTKATLDLALATGEDLAESARVAAGTLRGFGMEADEMTRVTDVMAASFSSSALDLEKFTTGMSIVAPVAKNAGASIEEATAMIAVLADANMDASTAGTSLRNIFLTTAEKGITFREAMDRIQQSTNKNATALELFGKRGATAATIIAENINKAKELTSSFGLSEGAASEMAAIMDDTVTGAFFRLRSAIEGTMIRFMELGGKGAVIKQVIDRFAEFILKNQEAIVSISGTVAKIAAFTVAGGLMLILLGGVSSMMIQFNLMMIKIIKTSALMTTVFNLKALSIQAVAKSMKMAMLGFVRFTVVGAVILSLAAGIKLAFEKIQNSTIDFKEATTKVLTVVIGAYTLAKDVVTTAFNGIKDAIQKVLNFVGRIFDRIKPILERMGEKIASVAEDFGLVEKAQKALQVATGDTEFSFEKLAEESRQSAENMIADIDGIVVKANELKDSFGEIEVTGISEKLKNEIQTASDAANVTDESTASVFDNMKSGFDTLADRMNKFATQDTFQMTSMMDSAVQQLSDGMTDSLMNFFKTGESGLKEFAAKFLDEMARMYLQSQVINPLMSQATNFIGGFFGGGGAGGTAAPRAMGGSVAPNTPYMVGEKGRELFVPQSAGTIIPNEELGGGGTTINFNVQAIDSQSFGSALAEHRAQITGIVENAYRMRGKRGALTA